MKDTIVVLIEKKNKIFILNLFIVATIFLIDRLCKLYVINLYEDISNQQIFLTSFLNVYLIWNEGIAFGLLSFESLTIYNIITFLIVLINILIIYILFKLDDVRKYFFFPSKPQLCLSHFFSKIFQQTGHFSPTAFFVITFVFALIS